MLRRAASFFSPWISSPISKSLLHQQKIQAGFMLVEHFMTDIVKLAKVGDVSNMRSLFITFILGGPGSGKGTQCAKIAEAFGFAHLSAGDLLRMEMSSNSENGAMIRETIKAGRIVPSEVTVGLISKAIESSKKNKILIDGFPRSNENRIAFERIVGVEPDLVVFFDCPEEEMVKRVLSRNQGRIDDNIETVKKRLKMFSKHNLPVVDYYSGKGKVYKINAVGTIDEVFEKLCPIFATLSLLVYLSACTAGDIERHGAHLTGMKKTIKTKK